MVLSGRSRLRKGPYGQYETKLRRSVSDIALAIHVVVNLKKIYLVGCGVRAEAYVSVNAERLYLRFSIFVLCKFGKSVGWIAYKIFGRQFRYCLILLNDLLR